VDVRPERIERIPPAAQTIHAYQASRRNSTSIFQHRATIPVAKSNYRRRGPSADELRAAVNKIVPDVIAPGLRVLFCGINPGLYTAAVGHHFARPGNRFWPALYAAGFTRRLLAPSEEDELLKSGYGITNLVARPTATAAELTATELTEGVRRLRAKIRRYRPGVLAVLGISAYRAAFGDGTARLGPQPRAIGTTQLWVLPNPSGLNAHYTPRSLARLFRELRNSLGSP
jgi:double-stranded uracil-DNA glycosylase